VAGKGTHKASRIFLAMRGISSLAAPPRCAAIFHRTVFDENAPTLILTLSTSFAHLSSTPACKGTTRNRFYMVPMLTAGAFLQTATFTKANFFSLYFSFPLNVRTRTSMKMVLNTTIQAVFLKTCRACKI